MIGTISYLGTTNSALASPYAVADFYSQLATSLNINIGTPGQWVNVPLSGYAVLDPTRVDTRHVSSTPTGYTEVISYGARKGWVIEVDWVEETGETLLADPFRVMESLNDHLNFGFVKFQPSVDSLYSELCVANKIYPPVRHALLNRWKFKFDLRVIPVLQAVRAVPSLVPVV